MTRARVIGSVALGVAFMGSAVLGLPSVAEARGHRAAVFVGVGGFYGWGPFASWGPWGWGPGWGPYGYAPYGYYGPARGMDMGYAMMAGFGALDVNVKPNSAEVWVDGRYYAEARDLDGYPSYLWLKDGSHHLIIYKGGYRRFEEDVEVPPGTRRELKVRLEKGESQPPKAAPAGPPRSTAAEAQPEARGELQLRVRPDDATVYVDGRFYGIGRDLQTLRLPAGKHRVELVRPGFRPLEKEIDVTAGRTLEQELEMERP